MNLVLLEPSNTFFTLDLPSVIILQRLSAKHTKFQDVVDGNIQRGVSPDYLSAFVIESEIAIESGIEPKILRPVVMGKHISRYGSISSSMQLIYLTRFLLTTLKSTPRQRHIWVILKRYNVQGGYWRQTSLVCSPQTPWPHHIWRDQIHWSLTTTRHICCDETDSFYATDALYVFR